jgi:hypothetical protein
MKPIAKKVFAVFMIALVHFGASKTVVAIALALASGKAVDGDMSMWVKFLIWMTRILYFPIVSFSLYSREWFPGKLIHIPIFLNSLLWAMAIYFSTIFFSRIFRLKNRRPSNG